MSYDEYGWHKFLQEARNPAPKQQFALFEQRLLRELDEEELEHIRDAIDGASPDTLAFDRTFKGKTRLVIDFPTIDTSTDLGKFVDEFRALNYDVNWEKGLISGEKELKDGSISRAVRQLTGEPEPEPKKRKIQMKIGKFWAKIYELSSKREALTQKVLDYLENEGYYDGKRSDLGHSYGRLTHAGELTGVMIEAALDESEQKRYQQLADQLEMYSGGRPAYLSDSARAKKNQEYWQQNADYIKKNIGNLTVDKYVIIITRDPIDILRMSDFNRIYSCHSPPSRGSGESFYKCAVAEAHGHGAVAYAVETEELLSSTESKTIEQAEAAIQDGEIFADEMRGSHIGLSMEMVPVARTRLRQVRFWDDEDEVAPAGQPDIAAATQLAVPEQRVYGLKIPGFRDRVSRWAKETQSEQIESIPENAAFVKFGGSHEDNNIGGLLSDLLGVNINKDSITQDTETEDALDEDELLTGLVRRIEEECENFQDYWNNTYQAVEVGYNVEDDGGGGVYIEISAEMKIVWEADEWLQLPDQSQTANWAVSELNDLGWGWATDPAYLSRQGDNIVLNFQIAPEGLPDFGAQSYAATAEDFETFCVEVNRVDDMYDGIKQELERHFKREGYMSGGALYTWGMEILNGDFTLYSWDPVAEEDYEGDIENIEVSINVYLDPPDGMSAKDASVVVENREFSIPLRKALVADAHKNTGLAQYPQFKVRSEILPHKGTDLLRTTITFFASYNDSDEQIKVMKETVEIWDDDDEVLRVAQEVFDNIVGNIKPSTDEPPAPVQQTTTESIVKSWKSFLYN